MIDQIVRMPVLKFQFNNKDVKLFQHFLNLYNLFLLTFKFWVVFIVKKYNVTFILIYTSI